MEQKKDALEAYFARPDVVKKDYPELYKAVKDLMKNLDGLDSCIDRLIEHYQKLTISDRLPKGEAKKELRETAKRWKGLHKKLADYSCYLNWTLDSIEHLLGFDEDEPDDEKNTNIFIRLHGLKSSENKARGKNK